MQLSTNCSETLIEVSHYIPFSPVTHIWKHTKLKYTLLSASLHLKIQRHLYSKFLKYLNENCRSHSWIIAVLYYSCRASDYITCQCMNLLNTGSTIIGFLLHVNSVWVPVWTYPLLCLKESAQKQKKIMCFLLCQTKNGFVVLLTQWYFPNISLEDVLTEAKIRLRNLPFSRQYPLKCLMQTGTRKPSWPMVHFLVCFCISKASGSDSKWTLSNFICYRKLYFCI